MGSLRGYSSAFFSILKNKYSIAVGFVNIHVNKNFFKCYVECTATPPPPCIWTNLNSSIMQVSPPEYKPEPEPEPECITFYFR